MSLEKHKVRKKDKSTSVCMTTVCTFLYRVTRPARKMCNVVEFQILYYIIVWTERCSEIL